MIKQIYKDNFGVIFSIGSACKPAYQLKCNHLRPFAAPLDYQMEYSLRTVLHLFQTKFEDFFLNIEEDFGGGGSDRKEEGYRYCKPHYIITSFSERGYIRTWAGSI